MFRFFHISAAMERQSTNFALTDVYSVFAPHYRRVNLFSAKNVGWISAAHPPFRAGMVDALRLSTLLHFDCTSFIKNQSSLIFRTNLQEQIYPAHYRINEDEPQAFPVKSHFHI